MRTAFFLALILWSSSVSAQWLIAPESDKGFDRPHGRRDVSPYHIASAFPAIPHWVFPNINVTQSPIFDQNEPSIAIDPRDSLHVIIGGNDDRNFGVLWAYETHDGGMTWSNTALPDDTVHLNLATDPSVDFDNSGNAYFGSGLSRDEAVVTFLPNAMGVYKLPAGSNQWTPPSLVWADLTDGGVDTSADKYYLAVDRGRQSPRNGWIHATWVEQFIDDSTTNIVFSYSSDGGAHWVKRSYLSKDTSFYTAPMPAVGGDGTVFVTFEDITRHRVLVARALDGVHFENPTLIAPFISLGPVEPHGSSHGFPVIKRDVAVNSFSSIACDNQGSGKGRTYVSWAAKGSDNRDHIYLSASTDDGSSWSSPRAIESDTSSKFNDKFFSWIAVDPANGDVGIIYYDGRLEPDSLTDLFMSFSTDSGKTFTDRRISNAPSNPRSVRDKRTVGTFDFSFFGDYNNLAARNTVWRPAWNDTRTNSGDCEIYSAIVRPRAPLPVTNLRAKDTLVAPAHGVLVAWDYPDASTTFGRALQNYSFRVHRTDRAEEATVDQSQHSFYDSSAYVSESYRYLVTVEEAQRSNPDSVQYGAASTASEVSTRLHARTWINAKHGSVTLEVSVPVEGKLSIRIFDELGRVVSVVEQRASANLNTFDITEAPGLYFYQVALETASGQQICTGKIVMP